MQRSRSNRHDAILALRLGLAMFLAGGIVAPAHAEPQTIGLASSVENQVTGTVAGKTAPLPQGADVFANETIRTEPTSLARLTFQDDTNLAVGPSSSVVLDKYVYDTDRSAASAVLNTALGGFRFATGHSDPNAFKINTPVATIGIRGTVLDIENTPGQSLIVLKRGALHVCLRNQPSKCTELTKPNDFVVVRKASLGEVQQGGAHEFDFRRYCSEGSFKNWNICELAGDFGLRDVTPGHSSPPPPLPPPTPVRSCFSTRQC